MKHFIEKSVIFVHKFVHKMKIITSREFRENQKNYFELAEKERVIIHRGNKRKPFLLVPITEAMENDLYFTDAKVIDAIEKGIEEVQNGKLTTIVDAENIWADIL